MTIHEAFRVSLAQVLEVDAKQLTLDTIFDEFETWDSLAIVSIVALVNEHFDRRISADKVQEARTLRDLQQQIDNAAV